jgi:phospholipid N-methyltransferase
MPNIVVQATIGSEELGPFTGVFKTPATLTYTARADTTSRTDFDAKFYDILEQLYRSPDLASYITTATNITCYLAKITSEGNSVVGNNRTWNRSITLDVMATAKK